MTTFNSMQEFRDKFNTVYKGLGIELKEQTKLSSNRLAGKIRTRVTNTGRNSEGGLFSAYSRSHIYKKNKYGKAPLGKVTNVKNFFYKGTMFDSFGLRDISQGKNGIVAQIGMIGDNVYRSNAELHEIHSGRENTIVAAPNKTEEDDFVKEIETAIYEYLERSL